MDDFETQIKVIVVGNGQVGKTSMISRFARGIFTAEYKKTLGVCFLKLNLNLLRLIFWRRRSLWPQAMK